MNDGAESRPSGARAAGSRRWRRPAAAASCVAAATAIAFVAPVRATGSTAITDCSDDIQLRADVTAGGTYAFACSGTIQVSHSLTASHDLMLDGTGQHVTIKAAGGGDRAFTITGGTVALTGLTLTGGYAPAVRGDTEPSGADGSAGQDGLPGPDVPNTPTPAQGGDLYVGPGARVTLSNDVIDSGLAFGGGGGYGGNGGAGGDGFPYTSHCGPAGNGGNAGHARAGTDGMGGGAYVSAGASLTLTGTTFSNDQALGGGGGGAGLQGNGGYGCPDGHPGAPADGKNAGSGLGGAIYSAGTLTIESASFAGDSANGGPGGDGSRGYASAVYGVRPGVPGNGANGGNGIGGAIYGPSTVCGALDFSNDKATAGAAGRGGNNFGSGDNYTPPTKGTDGSPGNASSPDALPAPTKVATCSVTLSGRLTEGSCTTSSCQSSGVANVAVSANGTSSSGSPASGAATTDSSGNWSIKLPAGAYRVTPAGDGWDPPHRDVSAQHDTAGLNFARCSASSPGQASDGATRCTATHVYCQHTEFGSPSTCLVVISDIAAGPKILPRGTVNITAFDPKSVLKPPSTLSCTLRNGMNRCLFQAIPEASETVVSADYLGDDKGHKPSTGVTSFLARPAGNPIPPQKAGRTFGGEDKQQLLELKSGCDLAKIPWGSGAVVAAVAPDVTITKGTAGVLAAGAATFQLCSWLSDFLRTVIDPPDSRFRVVAVPHVPRAPQLPGLGGALSATARALLANGLAEEAIVHTLATTVNRATSAQAAHDVAARTIQLGAAATYLTRLAALTNSDITLQRKLAGLMRHAHLGKLVLSPRARSTLRAHRHGPLPPALQKLLQRLGLSKSMLASLRHGLAASKAPDTEDLASTLVDVKIIRLERKLAAALLKAAKNPAPQALVGATYPVLIPGSS